MKTIERRAAPAAGEMRHATFRVEVKAEGERLRAVMSSPTVDRVGDSILQAGWDLSEFTANPVMLYQHRADEPVGIWRDVRIEGGNLTGEPVFHPAEINPFAGRLEKLYRARMLRAFSVGFVPLEFDPMPDGNGWIIKRAKLLECSAVTIPANADALLKAAPGASILPIFGDEPPAEARKAGRDEAAISKWVAPATEVRVESPAMLTRADVEAMIAKALGSIKDEQPPAQTTGDAPADGAAEGKDEDPVALALAAVDEAVDAVAELAAEIEGDTDE